MRACEIPSAKNDWDDAVKEKVDMHVLGLSLCYLENVMLTL